MFTNHQMTVQNGCLDCFAEVSRNPVSTHSQLKYGSAQKLICIAYYVCMNEMNDHINNDKTLGKYAHECKTTECKNTPKSDLKSNALCMCTPLKFSC